jgi:hypothetical protein
MNFTNPSKFVIDENFYKKIGSTWIIDSIYLAIISPIGFIGFILNLFCFAILCKIKIKETKIYEYLKIYSLNSSLICLTFGFFFMSHSPRYFKDFTNYYVKFFVCRLFAYGTISLYFFNNVLDILIILDRISIFKPKLNVFRLDKPYVLCSIAFVMCFLINLFYYFSIDIASNESYFESNSISYCEQNEFGKTRHGFILNLLLIVLRDIITLMLEIISSILVIHYYNKYKQMSIQILARNINNQNQSIDHNCVEVNIRKREKRHHLMIMTIILSIFSFVTHIVVAVVFVFLVFIIFENRMIFYSLVVFGSFAMLFKHFITIFIFYYFNANFKKEIRKLWLK